MIEGWLQERLGEDGVVVSVEHGEPGERRWYVRVVGEEKDTYSIWFALGQRTLHYETYFMPAPEENCEDCLRHLLRRNAGIYGMAFSIGAEEAIFLSGQLANEAICDFELDRILGTFYATVEQCFRPALRIGFATKFGGS